MLTHNKPVHKHSRNAHFDHKDNGHINYVAESHEEEPSSHGCKQSSNDKDESKNCYRLQSMGKTQDSIIT